MIYTAKMLDLRTALHWMFLWEDAILPFQEYLWKINRAARLVCARFGVSLQASCRFFEPYFQRVTTA
jgi:hypothetical protein